MNRTALRSAAALAALLSVPLFVGTGRAGADEEVDAAATHAEAVELATGPASDPSAPGDDSEHGGKGKCAAWELDGSLLALEHCPAKGSSHDYVECGKRVRDKVKELLCAKLGKGSHKYMYRVSDNKPSKSSVYCK